MTEKQATQSSDAAPQPITSTTADWQEEDYVQALAQLENIQHTVTSLRLTIPLLVRSLTRKHNSPQELYADFAKQAFASSRSIAELKTLWESSEMRSIIAQVDKGIKERGFSVEGVTGDIQPMVKDVAQKMPRYGWKGETEKLQGMKRKRENEVVKVLDDEQVTKAVEEFEKSRDGLTANFRKEPWQIGVEYKSEDGMGLKFEISKTIEEEQATYDVKGPEIPDNSTNGEIKLLKAVQRCLARGLKQHDLEYTLNSVVAYKNLKTAKCEVCQRIIDRDGLAPAARKAKKVKTDGGEQIDWVAAHETCMDGAHGE